MEGIRAVAGQRSLQRRLYSPLTGAGGAAALETQGKRANRYPRLSVGQSKYPDGRDRAPTHRTALLLDKTQMKVSVIHLGLIS